MRTTVGGEGVVADPPRLRSNVGSLEALLLRSSRSGEPPPEVEDEVWRRVQAVTAAGAALGATGLAVQTAATGSKLAKGALWLSMLKWTAVVAVAMPAAGVAAGMASRWAVRREATSTAGLARGLAAARPLVAASALPAPDSLPDSADIPAPVLAAEPPRSGVVAPRARVASVASTAQDAPSALRKESLSLGSARGKFAAGDPRGALDEVARLGVEFPHGRLVQEREVLAIDCLAALGDGEAARTRAAAFLARFPVSPYAAHVRPFAER
jgi:hypothetical protein